MVTDPTSQAVAAPPGWMTFEFPCNERIRSLLRIESLFKRADYFCSETSIESHKAALWTLFELFDLVGGRGDVKSELLQELERQRSRLNQFSGKAGVSEEALQGLLNQIQRVFDEISAVNTRLGPHIAEHEWLQLLKGRFSIPGGVCEFDIPALHVWLHRGVEFRQTTIRCWLGTLQPIAVGVGIVTKLLRESKPAESHVASRGYFELSMDGRQIQLIRVAVPKQPEVAAEISANKYVVSVRFRQLDSSMHLKAMEQDIPFQMALCNF
jgi:cell division protein ZapD